MWLLTSAVLVLLAVGCYFTRSLLRSASVLYAFAGKQPPMTVLVYNKLLSSGGRVTDQSLTGSAGNTEVRVYTPRSPSNPPTIVLVHGTVADGNKSPNLNAFALALSRQGMRVVLPNLPEETHLSFRQSDVLRVADTIRWAADGGKVSVFGVSFGAGLAIPATMLPEAKPHVRLMFSISGYDDLTRIGEYYLDETPLQPTGIPYPHQAKTGVALLFGKQFLRDLVSPEDLGPFQAVINQMLARGIINLKPNDPLLVGLTPAQREDFLALQNVSTPTVHQRYHTMFIRNREAFAFVSPSSVLPSYDIPFYAMHGNSDLDIPVGELDWMQVQVTESSDSHFLKTPWLGHAVIRNTVTSVDRLRVGYFLAKVLTRAAETH